MAATTNADLLRQPITDTCRGPAALQRPPRPTRRTCFVSSSRSAQQRPRQGDPNHEQRRRQRPREREGGERRPAGRGARTVGVALQDVRSGGRHLVIVVVAASSRHTRLRRRRSRPSRGRRRRRRRFRHRRGGLFGGGARLVVGGRAAALVAAEARGGGRGGGRGRVGGRDGEGVGLRAGRGGGRTPARGSRRRRRRRREFGRARLRLGGLAGLEGIHPTEAALAMEAIRQAAQGDTRRASRIQLVRRQRLGGKAAAPRSVCCSVVHFGRIGTPTDDRMGRRCCRTST
mmetsp:Transcript_140627/g.366093  ORF Transcript_140627/g.366093 Transcript_140627/m.366093 type:complete len:288 (-) Transcript_140627:1262-2125(-)